MPLQSLLDLPAPAKLNLFLHVTGRRPDGYHLLQSVFVLIDWADTLHVELRRDSRLQRHDLGPALPPEDLALRAARALQQATGCTLGADISVLKQVPWGAGMGGGSSDAATVLLALNRLWGLRLPRARLLELAAPLGADVPFFIGGENAFVEGIGEILTPIEWAPRRYAVVKPAESVATPSIFSHPDLARNTEAATVAGSVAHMSTEPPEAGRVAYGHNDLQPVAEALCPPIAQVASWLEGRYGNSRMTGSGSAVFAAVGAEGATWSEGELPAGWVGRMCRSLAGHPLRDWAG